MKKTNTKELVGKLLSDKNTDNELLELFEKANTEELDEVLSEILPKDLDEVASRNFTKQEIERNYLELKQQIGLFKSKRFYLKNLAKYAAILLIPILGALWGTYIFSNKFNDNNSTLVFAVDNGNKGHVRLGDGSKVWLNNSSQIVYAAQNTRELKLDGQAYFEIAPNPEKEFTVKTEYFDIVVYGTSFNVSNYQSDEVIKVDLSEGSIGIIDNNTRLFKLEAGQGILYDKNEKHFTIIEKDMKNISLWKDSQLIIRDLNDKELFDKLSAWYGVNIELENKDTKERLYNLVITHESLENILSLVSKLSPMNYRIEKKEVKIRYK